MARRGLAGEVPSLELCREMAGMPALTQAFDGATFVWATRSDPSTTDATSHGEQSVVMDIELTEDDGQYFYAISAPTVREMLAWLDGKWGSDMPQEGAFTAGVTYGVEPEHDYRLRIITRNGNWPIHDPDALARICLSAAKAAK